MDYYKDFSLDHPLSVPLAVIAGSAFLKIAISAFNLNSKPASTKPFATFSEFYPFYLQEHSKLGTKITHFVGTSILTLLVARRPLLAAALLSAGALGYASFPLFRSIRHGILEMLVAIGTYLLVGHHLTGSWVDAFSIPVAAYSCAWFGHFFIEKNRPATFVYPTFSLFGDFRMFFEMLLGKHWK